MLSIYRLVTQNYWEKMMDIDSPSGYFSNFGMSISIDGIHGDNFIVGASAYNYYQGIVYIYNRMSESSWKLAGTIQSPVGRGQGFGSSVSLSENFAAVGTFSQFGNAISTHLALHSVLNLIAPSFYFNRSHGVYI